jgi:hypothetical protein
LQQSMQKKNWLEIPALQILHWTFHFPDFPRLDEILFPSLSSSFLNYLNKAWWKKKCWKMLNSVLMRDTNFFGERFILFVWCIVVQQSGPIQ